MACGKIASLLLLLFYNFSSSDAQGCLCLAVDSTASMDLEIEVLKNQLEKIIEDRLEEGTSPDIFTLVPFGDPSKYRLINRLAQC